MISKGNGIYYIEKMLFPMQIVVTGEFGENSHIWLKALTRSMDIKQAEKLLVQYERIQDEEYRVVASPLVV